jgi:hypothetical protein
MATALRRARAHGLRLSVTDEAERFSKHPACHLSMDEIKDVILTVAVAEHTPMALESLSKR